MATLFIRRRKRGGIVRSAFSTSCSNSATGSIHHLSYRRYQFPPLASNSMLGQFRLCVKLDTGCDAQTVSVEEPVTKPVSKKEHCDATSNAESFRKPHNGCYGVLRAGARCGAEAGHGGYASGERSRAT